LLTWLNVQPFRPFRFTLVSGKSYDVRHPELVRVGRTALTLFTPVADQPEVYDRSEMIGMLLVERIEPLEVQAP